MKPIQQKIKKRGIMVNKLKTDKYQFCILLKYDRKKEKKCFYDIILLSVIHFRYNKKIEKPTNQNFAYF